jgi:hypothetical protein
VDSLSRKQGMVWGGLLIFFGAMGLIQSFIDIGDWGWVALLTIAGIALLAVFFTDPSDWTLLIPAYVMFAIAGLIALTTLGVLRDEFTATYVLAAIALPFLVVFGRDRNQRWALIPAYVLLAVGVMVGLMGAGILAEMLVPTYVMFAIAIPFIVVYAHNPKQWWALIPAGVMVAIGLSLLWAGAAIQYILPVALILAGIFLVARQFMQRKSPPPDAPS